MFLRPGRLLYVGAAEATDVHAHHAFQLMVSFAEPIELVGNGPRRVVSSTALIPSDAAHAIGGPLSLVAILYLDSDGPDGRRLRSLGVDRDDPRAWTRAAECLEPLRRQRSPVRWADTTRFVAHGLTALLGSSADVSPPHPAVRRALAHVDRHLDQRMRIADLAAASRVSPSHLSHLFAREVGIPVRPYLRWRRLQRAAERLAAGCSLTEAAHDAGFSDSAHLTHVFRRMFGVVPSAVTRAALWVDGPTHEEGRFVQARQRVPR